MQSYLEIEGSFFSLLRLWERIYHEWFPASGYERARALELEVYHSGDNNADDYRGDVWIPWIG